VDGDDNDEDDSKDDGNAEKKYPFSLK